MKISTKGRYGLRFMLELGLHYGKGLLSLKEVSSRQQISEKYLEQIVIQLNRSHLVKSVRGAQGGYSLARAPEEITVGDILRVMEGSLSPVDCVEDGASCDRFDGCVAIHVWKKLKDAIDGVVDSITLANLVEDYYTTGANHYCI